MREIVYARANASVFWLNFVFLRMSMLAESVYVSRSKQILVYVQQFEGLSKLSNAPWANF